MKKYIAWNNANRKDRVLADCVFPYKHKVKGWILIRGIIQRVTRSNYHVIATEHGELRVKTAIFLILKEDENWATIMFTGYYIIPQTIKKAGLEKEWIEFIDWLAS